MARDPNNPYDIEEARRRSLARQPVGAIPMYNAAGQLLNEADLNTAPQRTGTQRARDMVVDQAGAAVEAFGSPAVRAVSEARGLHRSTSQATAPRQTVDRPTPRVNLIDPSTMPATEAEVGRATNNRASGLTRIVKTGDGTYVQTSDPNVQGESRIYDALGNRADRSEAEGLVGGPPSSVRDYYQRVQNGADLMGTPEGRDRILERGRESLAITGRMQAGAAAAREKEIMDMLSPKDRMSMLTEAQREAGLDRRAAATLAVTREGQRASQVTAQTGAIKAANDREQYERERFAANPAGYVQETMASMANMTPDEQTAFLSSNDPRAAQARAALARQLSDGEGVSDPRQITRAGGFRRFMQAPYSLGLTAPKYDANDGALVDNLFDPSDYGLTPDQLDVLIRASAQVHSRR